MDKVQSILNLVGRILISIIFLSSGIGKIFQFSGTRQYMASHGIPAVGLFLLGAIFLEIVGGLSLLLGCASRVGAFLLIVFLIPTTLIFHLNWSDQMQLIQFMKNLAILGGLFLILTHGSMKYGINHLWKE
ncbi:MAG: DoxX family protein [Acidobacteriota bacterium]